MKNYFVITTGLLLLCIISPLSAQKHKEKDKEKCTSVTTEVVEQKPDVECTNETNKANADSAGQSGITEEISGSQYGHLKVTSANDTAMHKKEMGELRIADQEKRIKAHEEKIEVLKMKLKEQEDAGELTSEEIAARKEKILAAEARVTEMKAVLEKDKAARNSGCE